MMALKNEMREQKIIFFDGVCHLCNAFVDRLIQADHKGIFYFAPLQGETASNLLNPEETRSLQSILYFDQGQVYRNSEAVLRILTDLGGLYRVFFILRIVPPFLRNRVYRWVAKNRYRWFGEREFCRLPPRA